MAFDTNVAPPSPAALDIKPPQSISPLEAASQFQQVQAQKQALQTGQLQQQELQLNLQQRQKMNQVFQEAYEAQPDGSMSLNTDKVMKGMASAGIGAAIPEVGKGLTALNQSYATLKETNQKVAAAEQDAAGSLAATVQSAGNDPHLFHALLTDAVNRKVIDPSHFAPFDQAISQSLQQDPTGESARGLVKQYTDQMRAGSGEQQKQITASQSAAAATSRAGAAQREAGIASQRLTAELPGMQAKSAIEKASADALQKMTPSDWSNSLNSTVLDKNSPLYRRTMGAMQLALSRGDLKGAQAAIKDAGDQLGKTESAIATLKASEPIEINKAVATARAMRSGDNPAVAAVAPAAVGGVQDKAIKLDEDYIKAKSATDAMGKMLDLAESGNKEAGSNVPLVGVETLNAINGIKRINSAEISQYGSAGSLLDQIKGKLGKLAVGKPIPQDVLNDIRELHQTLGQQSYQNYTDSLNALNTRSGAKFQPTIGAPNISKGAQPLTLTYQGHLFTFKDPAKMAQFKKDQGIQ